MFRCPKCRKNFSVLVGTIFENTKISLVKWFMAMYFISSHKKGVSFHQLSRDIDVTQKTAWYMLQKVRSLYAQDTPLHLAVKWNVMKCTLAARRNGSISL